MPTKVGFKSAPQQLVLDERGRVESISNHDGSEKVLLGAVANGVTGFTTDPTSLASHGAEHRAMATAGTLITDAELSAQLARIGVVGGTTRFTPTASSGNSTVPSANTDKTALAAKADRVFLLIQNPNQSAWLTVNYGAAAYSGGALVGFSIPPGEAAFFDSKVPTTDVHIASATAGAAYYILEG